MPFPPRHHTLDSNNQSPASGSTKNTPFCRLINGIVAYPVPKPFSKLLNAFPHAASLSHAKPQWQNSEAVDSEPTKASRRDRSGYYFVALLACSLDLIAIRLQCRTIKYFLNLASGDDDTDTRVQ